MVKIILVDDHRIFRESLKKLLSSEIIGEVIAEASNGKQFLELLGLHDPDLVLMDISMPVMDGIEATKKALEKKPDLKILTLSSFGEEKYYYKMVDAGVKGFLIKDCGMAELSQAINEVVNGGSWFSNELLHKVIINIGKFTQKEIDVTDREKEILKLVCDGLTNDQIADKLCLSSDTVKWHRNNLLVKTNSNNTAALVLYAIKNKLIEI
jgi:DNA-binding NarL/FixJ family response regulator